MLGEGRWVIGGWLEWTEAWFGVVNTQHSVTDDVLQKCAPKISIILLNSVTPINSILRSHILSIGWSLFISDILTLVKCAKNIFLHSFSILLCF